jgi:hypothetical protein
MKQERETVVSVNLETGELQDLFKKHVTMYTLPRLSQKETTTIFQKKYLPSINKFIAPKINNIEIVKQKIRTEIQKDTASIASLLTADMDYLKSIVSEINFSASQVTIFKYLDDLDVVNTLENSIEIIDAGLKNKQNLNVQLSAYGRLIILSDKISESEEERVDKILEASVKELAETVGGYFLNEFAIITLTNLSNISQKSIDHLRNYYQKATNVITKNLILGCLLMHSSERKFSEEEIQNYLAWREEGYNSNLYYHFHQDFLKSNFGKTGGEIKLFGKNLFNKIIQHKLPTTSFLAWRKAYENPEAWEKAGFDYVPIGPIISFRQDDDYYTKVNSGVLGITLWEYEKIFGKNERLFENTQKIKKVLNNLNIEYNYQRPLHWHRKNFCLQFERDEKGRIDLKKTPQIYLIDWDYAIIS